MSARGPIPNLAEAIAGEPIRGSWWGHSKSHHMYRVFESVCDSDQVLVCRLVGGKVTLIHRRLWPALVRLASYLPPRGLAAVRNEHTPRGHHQAVVTPFPRWVPKAILREGRGLHEVEAVERVGEELFRTLSGRKFAPPKPRVQVSTGRSEDAGPSRRARARRS